MNYSKSQLLGISKKITSSQKLAPLEIATLLSFEKKEGDGGKASFVKKAAVPVALTVGFLIAVFPEIAERVVDTLPPWTNLPQPVVRGADYFWNILSEPVGEENILYHLPNIILYAFGILGIKKLFDAIDRRTWVDRVNSAKRTLADEIHVGSVSLLLKKGHTVLFLGRGDFIGQQYAIDHMTSTVVISECKPSYTNLWNYFSPEGGYDDLEALIGRVCQKETGEYVFFPVKDDQIFLPAPHAYDVSPHRLDIICQDIRLIEKKNKWKSKRIIIVGDKYHKSFVQSEDMKGKVKGSEDTITLLSVSKKYPNATLVDPTDIVLRHILSIARGRKIVFRATKEGISEYKERFYKRLELLGYKSASLKKGILTIGYDLFEDLTEQQTLSRTIDDYYPVVLSKLVKDALVRNGYKKNEFIYVPDLVLDALHQVANKQ